MTRTFTASATLPRTVDAIVVPVGAGRIQPRGVKELTAAELAFLEARAFEGQTGEVQLLPRAKGAPYVVAVGVGELSKVTPDILRKASGVAARASKSAKRVASLLPAAAPAKVRSAAVAATVDGAGLASYVYTAYRAKAKPSALASFTVVTDTTDAKAVVKRAAALVQAQCMARDLVNGPPDEINPRHLSALARKIGRANDLKVTVWGPRELEANKMGGILGVAIGSDQPPQYVEMTYTPKTRKTGRIVVVGKGLTFDSGGLSLKSGEGMMAMKMDMAGSAAVLGLMSVITELQPTCEVIGIFCATENMPGPSAIMPGDVLRARNGVTIEVLNTDAEGRLVLADGLSRAAELKPDAIIDLATLTGACIVALGVEIAALMGNNPSFVGQVKQAGDRAGEAFWELPLDARYRSHIDSHVADLKNIGNAGQAGSIIGGLFLQEFVNNVPWVHLDIAGTAYGETDDAHITKGGTGFGIRTLAELVTTFVPPKEHQR